jgi:hypothetical protein
MIEYKDSSNLATYKEVALTSLNFYQLYFMCSKTFLTDRPTVG